MTGMAQNHRSFLNFKAFAPQCRAAVNRRAIPTKPAEAG